MRLSVSFHCPAAYARMFITGTAYKGLIREYGLSSRTFSKLQLYISDGILLEKHMMKVDKKHRFTSYALKKVEDYYVKQIYFKKETPCIVMTAAPDKLGRGI